MTIILGDKLSKIYYIVGYKDVSSLNGKLNKGKNNNFLIWLNKRRDLPRRCRILSSI